MDADYSRQKAYRLRKAAQVLNAAKMEKALREIIEKLGERATPIANEIREIAQAGLGA